MLQGTLPPQTVAALGQLVSLFGLATLVRDAGDFLEDGYLTRQQVHLVTRHTSPSSVVIIFLTILLFPAVSGSDLLAPCLCQHHVRRIMAREAEQQAMRQGMHCSRAPRSWSGRGGSTTGCSRRCGPMRSRWWMLSASATTPSTARSAAPTATSTARCWRLLRRAASCVISTVLGSDTSV